MRSKMKLYYLLAGFWAMAGVLMGAVYHVAMPSAGGDDVNSGLDWANPKASISNALAQGDVTEILVSNGMYQLADIVSVSKAVHIRSWNNGAIDRDGTIMVGAGTNRCFRISHAGGIVDGFTITNGFSQDGVLQSGDSTSTAGRGGGVFITHSGGLLTNCLIIGNTVKAGANYKGGGGVFLMGGAIWNCRITGNIVTNDNASSAMGGGVGVYLYDTSGYPTSMVVNCEIDNNNIYRGITYNNGGGGVGVYRAALIDNCDIYGNSSGAGGGLLAHTRGVTTITNTRIFNNNSEGRAGGIFVMKTEDDHGVRITDCLISNNTATSASSLGGGIFVDGNSTNVLIYNCMIVDNKSGLDGGGAYIAAGVVHGGIVSNNSCHGSNAGGGGLYLGPNKTNMVFIRDVRIVNNRAKADGAWGGGGVMMVNTWLENCFIANNHAIGCRGGGVYAHLTNTVVSCTILNNTADMYGGGVYAGAPVIGVNYSDIRNCLIAGNLAAHCYGGGIYLINNLGGTVSACTVVDNEVQGTASQQRGAGIFVSYTNNIYNCIVYSNRWSGSVNDQERDLGMNASGDMQAQSNSVHYCCSPRDFGGARGNITNSPSFAGISTGNYRLTKGSDGINSGTNLPWMLIPSAVDLDGRPRRDRFSRLVDMGCYEYVPGGMMFSIW